MAEKEYIEREAAVDALARLCKRVCQYSEKQRQYMCGACSLGDAFTVIEDDLPAADVWEVVHCDDCIHAEESLVSGCVYRKGMTDEHNKAARLLWNKEHCWIPVAERLPEYDQKVLAWVKNKDPEGRFNRDGIYTAELKDKVPKPDPEGKKNFWGIPGYDSVWTVWSWSYFTEPDVLYWMPLPPAPKEEE